MTEQAAPDSSKPTAGIGVGIFFLAGPAVICLAGLAGLLGERLAGGLGYWLGCYLAGALAAAAVALIFARLFRGDPLYWAFGAAGMLLGAHLTWIVMGGRAADAPDRRSDAFLCWLAGLCGMLLGFAAAHPIIRRRPPRDAA